ncbi:MAG: prolipoprotein diacylglyceryl transferase [Deltaproteobacteria bacterium]|nr:prolipoprotein diacylglyceryl transferase [Deltaproteobacteria bacterium]
MKPWLVHTHVPVLGQVALSAWFTWLVIALAVGMFVAVQEQRRAGDRPIELVQAGMIGIVAGVIGGRLGHLFTSRQADYLADPLALLRFWEGGMVLYGGLALALLASAAWIRLRGMSFLRSADAAAPALAIGVALGRVGCLSAGCCYGRPIDWGTGIEWPWGVVFLQGVVPDILRGIPLHPTQAYAAAAGLALFGFLRALRARQSFDGQVIGALLVGYPLMRGTVELFRLDLERGFFLPGVFGQTISTSQALSVPVLVLGVGTLVVAHRRARDESLLGLDAQGAREARQRSRIEAALAAR